jgi:DNA-binding MarR family transcriptional regulator
VSARIDHVRRIQRAYPQLWHACHVEHATRRREHGLSDRDVFVLGHLDVWSPVTAGALAKHLGVGASTITEAMDRLERAGLAERTRIGRKVELTITPLGVAHMQAGSVLDTARLELLVAQIPPRDREVAVRGFEILADAARKMLRR